jgi:hypothetical protein
MSRNWLTLFPPRRRRTLGSATNVEAVESRLVLSTLDPTGTAGMLQPPETPTSPTGTQPPVGYQLPGRGFYQPPQQTVTGTVSIDINYQYLSPDLVFNGVGDTSVPDVLRYDSGVPFNITGQTNGPAKLVIIHPDGHLEAATVNGPFSMPRVFSTSGVLGTEMELKVQLFAAANAGQVAPLLASAVRQENLNVQTFRFEDYLGKLGGQADKVITNEVNGLVEDVFENLLTDASITQIATDRFGAGPTFDQKQQIKNEIEAARDLYKAELDRVGRFALQEAIFGNKMEHKFVFGSGHPSGSAFENAMSTSRVKYTELMELGDAKKWVKFSMPMPSLDDLMSDLSSMNSVDDVRSRINSVPVTLSIEGPEIPILDGVAFQAKSRFVGQEILTATPSLSGYEMSAGINFFSPTDSPPNLFGPLMRGSFQGYFRQGIEGSDRFNGGDARTFGVDWLYNY